jgi:hypothetical protein
MVRVGQGQVHNGFLEAFFLRPAVVQGAIQHLHKEHLKGKAWLAMILAGWGADVGLKIFRFVVPRVPLHLVV